MAVIKESEHIHRGGEYFDENSATPFVKPNPNPQPPPQNRQPYNPNVLEGMFPSDEDDEEYGEYGHRNETYAPNISAPQIDSSSVGQLLVASQKLYQVDKTNVVEKLRLIASIKVCLEKVEEEAAIEKAELLKELGVG